MDLLGKAVIAAVILAIIIVGAYIGLQKITPQTSITQYQAASLVNADLQNVYPGAAVNITNVTPSAYPGSWHVTASIVLNATRPCPTYLVYSFDYPKYGFVYTIENRYTQGCVIYGMQNSSNYLITSPPVAIARSYNLGIPSVTSFVSKYGYDSVHVTAQSYKMMELFSTNYTNLWVVNYSAPAANYSLYVAISQAGGTKLLNYTVTH